MGWKEFAASVIGDVLSWPVAFLVAVILLLRPIKRLIGRIRSVKGGGLDVELRDDLLEAGVAALEATKEAQAPNGQSSSDSTPGDAPDPAERQPAAPTGGETSTDSQQEGVPPTTPVRNAWTPFAVDRLLDEAAFWEVSAGMLRDPGELVHWAWGQLEASLTRLYRQVAGEKAYESVSATRMVYYLRKRGVLSESFATSMDRLTSIIKEVDHSDQRVSASVARDFRKIARSLKDVVDQAIIERSPDTGNQS